MTTSRPPDRFAGPVAEHDDDRPEPRLRDRWSAWRRERFTSESRQHVSV